MAEPAGQGSPNRATLQALVYPLELPPESPTTNQPHPAANLPALHKHSTAPSPITTATLYLLSSYFFLFSVSTSRLSPARRPAAPPPYYYRYQSSPSSRHSHQSHGVALTSTTAALHLHPLDSSPQPPAPLPSASCLPAVARRPSSPPHLDVRIDSR
ncbi:uncharacterized protein BKA78DRAFT_296277 [Phyllosticta capitalensis]|uniref:uncharacterized protein n=1 Tax=Phyllosticta capitalensis TaxID=121624 RepID=UPI00312F6CC0